MCLLIVKKHYSLAYSCYRFKKLKELVEKGDLCPKSSFFKAHTEIQKKSDEKHNFT